MHIMLARHSCSWHFMPGGDRRDAAPRPRGQHRRVQGRHGPVPGQRQRADDRLRRAADRSPGHVAADAVDRTSTCKWSAAAPARPTARSTAWSWTSPATADGTASSTRSTSTPRQQERSRRRNGKRTREELPGLQRDQPDRRRGVLLLRLRMAEAEADGQARDLRRRGPDPHRRAGVVAGHRRQLPPPSKTWRSGRATVVPGRLSLRSLAPRGIRLLRAPRLPAHLRRALVVRAGGIPRPSRRRWPRRCSASTSSIRWSRSRPRVKEDFGASPIAASGGRMASSSRLTGTKAAG